jgi:hypothetical protein
MGNGLSLIKMVHFQFLAGRGGIGHHSGLAAERSAFATSLEPVYDMGFSILIHLSFL